MPYFGVFGGALAPPIFESQAVADSIPTGGGSFFDQVGKLQFNAGEVVTGLAPAALAIVAAPFTGGASLFTYAANASLDAAAQDSQFLQDNKALIKLATSAAKIAYGDGSTAITSGGGSMGFFDDIFGNSTDTIGDSSSIFSGVDYGQILNAGVGAGLRAINNYSSQSTPSIMPGAALAAVPAVIMGGSAVAVRAGSAIAAKLATMGLTRVKAYSLLRRYGPASLTAIGLTALEVAQVSQGGSGRRRMNVCNGRALRRASRRLEGFHKFYKRTCGLSVKTRRRKSC